jgi:hypothetical protein
MNIKISRVGVGGYWCEISCRPRVNFYIEDIKKMFPEIIIDNHEYYNDFIYFYFHTESDSDEASLIMKISALQEKK